MTDDPIDELPDELRVVALGAAGGAAATAAMSALMVAAREAGLMSELPPHEITSKAIERNDDPGDPDDLADEVDEEEQRELGWAAHFAFGAAAGALYALARRAIPTRLPEPFTATVYALAIWAVSYAGWVPALRFLPPPDRDEPGRQPAMVAAHVVFGAVLGLIVDRALRRRRGA